MAEVAKLFRATEDIEMHDDNGKYLRTVPKGELFRGYYECELVLATIDRLPGEYCWIIHPEQYKEVKKRVLQISIDALVDADVDGCKLAEDIRERLDGAVDICPLGAEFVADMTEQYEESYPEMLEEN